VFFSPGFLLGSFASLQVTIPPVVFTDLERSSPVRLFDFVFRWAFGEDGFCFLLLFFFAGRVLVEFADLQLASECGFYFPFRFPFPYAFSRICDLVWVVSDVIFPFFAFGCTFPRVEAPEVKTKGRDISRLFSLIRSILSC